MRKTINLSLMIAAAILLFSAPAKAQTAVPGGYVSGTWNLAGSPYLINGSLMIQNGQTLTIEPGVDVIFQGHYKLVVEGRLLAVGSAADSISFAASDTAVGWQGIRFVQTPVTNDSSRIKFCKIQYGKATNPGEENGGAICIVAYNKIEISNNYIAYNYAGGKGGGIFCNYDTLTISDCIFFKNRTNQYSIGGGGGIFAYSSSLIISNSTFSQNYSSEDGGGFSCYEIYDLTITDCFFNTNLADGLCGGGIKIERNLRPAYLINNIIKENKATEGAGIGIKCAVNNVYISNNIITNNFWCAAGGGIYIDLFSPVQISNNVITNNTASGGGGIYSSSSGTNIINNNISNNNGGGIKIQSDGVVNIISNNISNNNGGGITIDYSFYNNDIDIINNVIANNNGSGTICSYSKNIDFINNTIVNNNSTKGGAVYCDQDSDPNFYNNIIYGNTATNGSQVYLDDEASDPNFYNCDIRGGSAAFDANGNFFTGNYLNNIDTDPLFIAPSGGSGTGYDGVNADWSLQFISPCIDTGDTAGISNVLPATDYAGNPRIAGTLIDLGAFEADSNIISVAIATTNVLCYGDTSGAADLIVSGGFPPYSFNWSNSDTTQDLSNVAAGSYSVTITDSHGNMKAEYITIIQPSVPVTVSFTATNVNCHGDSTGAINITSSGSSGYAYNWSNGAISEDLTNIPAGIYSVTVVDVNGCAASNNITILQPTASLSDTIIKTNASCFACFDGNASVLVNGGTTPYSYLWNTGATQAVIIGLGVGNYSVCITDGNGCQLCDSVVISSGVGITANTSNNSFSLYPNPANDNLTIYLPSFKPKNKTTLELFNINGKLLKSLSIVQSKTQIDISEFAAGVYVIRVIDDEGVIVERFVKE